MNNNVTIAVAQALAEASINALLFNFRGVGASEGNYSGGDEEQKDVMAALDWLQARPDVDSARLGLAGYSFGAGVAASVACSDKRVKALAMISPYFGGDLKISLKQCPASKLFITGSADSDVLPDEVANYAAEASEPKQLIFINGPDHFWGGYEKELASVVSQFFSESLR